MTSRRVERVADLIRQELSEILRKEVRDPRVRDASVTRVDLSTDLQHARALISVLDPAERDDVLEGLRRATGFIRSRLAVRIDLRHAPELRFDIDHGAEHSLRISEILESLAPELEAPAGDRDGAVDGGDAPAEPEDES
ncbi:MAG TPA: 30S ribosome-binding factor RbfA [Thermoanaerobaculia bacterium]|nr:30S ribosome-binding factor RbfA [Thermoanaerobaculia bacterium]